MTQEFVFAKMTGSTASYRIPSIIDGDQLALTVPGYSSILGMLSFASGREISIADTRIGMSYRYSYSGFDLEKFHRFERSSTGKYKYNKTNIRRREIQYGVELGLILDNLDLFDILDNPKRQLTLGRSQDLVNVESVEIVKATKIETANLLGTLLPLNIGESIPGNGIFYNLPEYFDYKNGKVRKPKNIRTFLALTQDEQEVKFENLYKIYGSYKYPDFYLHDWKEDNN